VGACRTSPHSGGLPASPIQLTNDPASFGTAAPDPRRNHKLWALGVQPAGEFVKYDLGSKRLISIFSGISGTNLDFSCDGKWMAYVAIPEGTLWRCRQDGNRFPRVGSFGRTLQVRNRFFPKATALVAFTLNPVGAHQERYPRACAELAYHP
jgi:hypothetical protein